jgi:hypothetical protein
MRAIAAIAALAVACSTPESARVGGVAQRGAKAEARFVDVTAAVGIDFIHRNAATERRYLPETMGAGVAIFDYDGDRWPDIYFVNGAPAADAATGVATGALYRNLGDGRFVETTAASGLARPFLGMGAAVGDFDNDGDVDLFVTGVAGDHLFRNDEGVFTDVAAAFGLTDAGFGSSAAFVDIDRDGWLDLFIGRYVEWSPATDRRCSPDGVHPSYCTPEVYPGASNRLYRNLEGTRFADVTAAAGVLLPEGKTLGVVALDYDLDGWPDLATANDTTRNFLFHNTGTGALREVGVEEGLAYSASGSTRGGMGIDAGDSDGDGRPEVAIGNFAQEMSAIYRATGGGPFRDDAAQLGVGLQTLMTLAFGTLFLDYDLDGWLDLLIVNGHIEPTIGDLQPQQTYAQAAALFHNLAPAEGFGEVADPGDLGTPLVGRGLAVGDLDRDGDGDVVITQNGGAARVFRNETPGGHWLRLELTARSGSVTPYGARATAWVAGRAIRRTLASGRSYLSASEPTIELGVGEATMVDRLEVRWPSGLNHVLFDVEVDASLELSEPAEPSPPPTSARSIAQPAAVSTPTS